MPPLNGRAQIVGGVAAGTVSIDNTPVAPGGCACWLDDDTVIFNGPDAAGVWALRTYSLITGTIAVLDPRGANFIAAGGGRWVAQAGPTLYGNWAVPPGAVMALRITDGRGCADPFGK